MATGKRPPAGEPGARRRRSAPTIDLKATEVASEPVAAAAQAEQPGSEPRPETAGAAASEPPRASSKQTQPDSGGVPPPPKGGWLPLEFPWPAAVAGAIGAAGVMLVVLLLWLMLPRSGDAVATLNPRLSVIETQLRDLAARPAPAGIDPAALDELTARLAKLESALNAPRPPGTDPVLTKRLDELAGGLARSSSSVTALSRQVGEIDAGLRDMRGRADVAAAALTDLQNTVRAGSADRSETAKLSSRVAALEKSDRTVADQIARSAAAAGSDRAARLAVAAAALRTAIERGDPFAAELAAVKPLTSDTNTLSAIEPFAGSGVPSAAALGRELLVLLPVMQRAAGTAPRDGGFLDRLQANAGRLVRIRPIEEIPGEDPAAILSRVEVKAAHADIAGTLAELAKLPPTARAPASDWIAKAQARQKAIEAGRRLAADAVAALKTTP
jgi:hypothetical protein